MKYLSLTMLLLLFTICLYTQTFSKLIYLDLPTEPEDSTEYNFYIRESIAVGMEETIVFGAGAGTTNKKYYMARLNKNGEQVWGKRLTFLVNDDWLSGFSSPKLSLTSSGELLLCLKLFYGSGEHVLFVAKIDLDGNLIWSNQIKGANFDITLIQQVGYDIYITGEVEDSSQSVIDYVLHLNQDGMFLSGKKLQYPAWAGHFSEPSVIYDNGQLFFIRTIREEDTGPNPDNRSNIIAAYDISTAESSSWYATIEFNGNIFHGVYVSSLAFDEYGNRYMSIIYGEQNLLAKYDANNNAIWCNEVDGYGSIILAEGQIKLLHTIPTINSTNQEGIVSYSQASGAWLSAHYGSEYTLEPFLYGRLKRANDGHLLWGARPRDEETLNNLGLEGIYASAIFRSDAEGQIENCYVFEACDGSTTPVEAPSYTPMEPLLQEDFTGLEQLPASIDIEDQDFNILPYCSAPVTFAAGFTFDDQPVCPYDTIVFTPTMINPPTATTTWIAEQALPSTSAADTAFFQFQASGIHEVHHIITVGGCNDTVTQTVEILPQPIFELGDNTDLCEGDSLLLESGLSTNAVNLIWQDSSTNGNYLVDETGLYILQATNTFGCFTIDSIFITTVPNPGFSLGQDYIICKGEQATLLPVPLPASPQFEWNTGATDDRLRVMYAGTYSLTVTDQETGCFAVDSINLIEQHKPQFTYGPKDTAYCEGVGLRLEALALDSKPVDFTWLGSGTPGTFFDVPSAGTYELIASDAVCKDTLQITIPNGLCQANVYLPNAFSPNGDGKNDLFQAFGPDAEVMNLQVYNRWGSLVFESHDTQAGWDGYVGGRKAEAGTYLYVLQYKNRLSLEEASIGGEFLLMR